MAKKKDKRHDAEVRASPAVARQAAEASQPPKMKRKEYEREMQVLHGELVAMQEWVKESGAKICIRQDPRAGCCRLGRQAGKDRLAARWSPQLPMNVQAAVAAGEGAGWPIGTTLATVGHRTLRGSGDRSSGWVKTGPAGHGSADLMAHRWARPYEADCHCQRRRVR